ncbi:MAG: type II toxin-antitoxin system VapC family toxin [Chloroflexi bacterium]|nr:type II toxin-antitoxin system VapC family toxin [Chloroflexota bacterium]MBU1660530.1 type II toxin-antitoxin system VapC family toxin [Chloroflexota bacterium]
MDITADVAAICASEYQFVKLTDSIVERSKMLLERHPLRGYDAVQLGSALSASDVLQASGSPALTFLVADNRLLDAAQAEGLAVDNPNDYS